MEKALLTGFGIFLLTSLISLISPFIGIVFNFNNNQNNELYHYANFINKFDIALKQVINNPDFVYFKEIEYPENLNLTLEDNYAKFYFLLDETIQVKILEYSELFQPSVFNNLPSEKYLLYIAKNINYINVSFF